MTEIQTVKDFLSALEDLDLDRALALAAPEIVYQNVPLPSVRGLLAVERTLRFATRYLTGIEARVNNIAADGPVVLTERTDAMIAGPWRAEFWVCGTFEVHDGRITLWRDYFDWTNVLFASGKGLVGALVSLLSPRPGTTAR